MSAITGRTFSVVALGCRTNHYEADAVVSMLERRGALFTPYPGSPDIVFLFTCSVTSVADAKTRKLLRRARRANPSAVIVACGCSAQELDDEELSRLGVDIVVGNRMKQEIPDALEGWFEAPVRAGVLSLRADDVSENKQWDELFLDRPRIGTRAFVKVQDGCSRSCSYCAVPRLRGAQTSRAPADVREEVSRVIASGCVEVLLTGIHLGGYEFGGTNLAGLIDLVSSIPGLARLRLGSIEPFAVGGDLLRAMKESPVFCRHLHIPLQSGDDSVLRMMRRGYDSADFSRIVGSVRRTLGDDVHLSTDLIAGFPGETDEAFGRSLGLLESAGFGRVHVFPFSPRAGTDAASMERRPGQQAVRERVSRAVALSERLLSGYASRWIGRSDTALVEKSERGLASGWTTHYIRVYVKAGKNFVGREILINPKSEIRGILLTEGIEPLDIVDFSHE
ncbi:MAG: MiaB/RimO family radical SAM methylthiotransferase [Synergistaceae bacterium]|nr:MiaB/RimO family radical SAM methylthiotransferase [Synergistaceae bacterium]